jgi:uncharacterized protein (TIGR00304 family)
MNTLRAVAWSVIALAVILIVVALIVGELKAALFLVFPVLYGVGLLAAAGILLLFVGVILLFASAVPSTDRSQEKPVIPTEPTDASQPSVERRTRFGGVVLVGPIPIVFGSDRRTAFWAMVAMALILVALALFILLWPFGSG